MSWESSRTLTRGHHAPAPVSSLRYHNATPNARSSTNARNQQVLPAFSLSLPLAQPHSSPPHPSPPRRVPAALGVSQALQTQLGAHPVGQSHGHPAPRPSQRCALLVFALPGDKHSHEASVSAVSKACDSLVTERMAPASRGPPMGPHGSSSPFCPVRLSSPHEDRVQARCLQQRQDGWAAKECWGGGWGVTEAIQRGLQTVGGPRAYREEV